MSAPAFARLLDEFCIQCLNTGIALNISSHVTRPLGHNSHSVMWTPTQERDFRRTNDLDLREYLDCIRCGDFSLLLIDGGLIQVSAKFRANEMFESRFYYIPCPVRFEKAELQVGDEIYPLEDFIEELPPDDLKDRLCIRAPFRFELDPANEGDDHPKNHVHIGPSSSHIPVALSMCWNSFSRFIFKNYYALHFPMVENLLRHPSVYREPTITAADSYELHMSFKIEK